MQAQIRAENPIVPHKVEFRMKLVEQLRNAGISEASGGHINDKTAKGNDDADIERLTKLLVQFCNLINVLSNFYFSCSEAPSSSTSSWLSKINPFGKKQET